MDSHVTRLEKPFETDLPDSKDRKFFTETFWEPGIFWQIVEQHHHSLHRYYAVHTNGDLSAAQEMTRETFSIIYHRFPSLQKQTFTSWLFGIAWDVLNAHYSRKEAETHRANRQKVTTFKVQKLGPDHTEMRRILKVLRGIPFYPRETLYLRFFAELNIKDTGILMDKNEPAVKVLLFQGLLEFIGQMDGLRYPPRSKEQVFDAAHAYHAYLDDVLSGVTPTQSTPLEVIRATNRLKALREVVTMQPQAHDDLILQVRQAIFCAAPSTTRL